jgi:hypothetical protein
VNALGIPRPLRARGDYITDEQRAQALAMAFDRAEKVLKLDSRNMNLLERAQQILMAARDGRLDPRLYQCAWFVRKTCRVRH